MSVKRSPFEIEQRRSQVIQAATSVFLRYGYARTTMAELASAARLSRPALYEVFPSKEELFAEVVRGLNRDAINGFRSQLPKLRSLRAKIQRFCRDWGTHGLKLAERHPDARDLFNMEVPAVREMYEEFIAFLTAVIISDTGLSQQQVEKRTYNLVFSLLGLEAAAHDVPRMEDLIRLQVDMFLGAIEGLRATTPKTS